MRTGVTATAITVALALSSCGGDAENPAADGIERSSANEAEAESDASDGAAAIESQGGSASVGGELPDEFADLPVPDEYEYLGGTVLSAEAAGTEDDVFSGALRALDQDQSLEVTVAQLRDFYASEGFEIDERSAGNLSVSNGDIAIAFTVTGANVQFFAGSADEDL